MFVSVALLKPVVNALENFQTIFPGNKPKGAIPRLIELLGLILRWEPDAAEIFMPLKNFIQVRPKRTSFYPKLNHMAISGSSPNWPNSLFISANRESEKFRKLISPPWLELRMHRVLVSAVCIGISLRRQITGE